MLSIGQFHRIGDKGFVEDSCVGSPESKVGVAKHVRGFTDQVM